MVRARALAIDRRDDDRRPSSWVELIDAVCYDLGALDQEPASTSRFNTAEAGDQIAELDGDSVTFNVDPETVYGCVFVNTLIPEDSVGAETETPAITLPPTDTFGSGPMAPANDSWRILLVLMAGILASVLILTPSPATRRR